MRPLFQRASPDQSFGQRRPEIALLLVLFSIVYAYWYLRQPLVPGNDPANELGWWTWWDQGQYWKAAKDLASGTLGQSFYWWGYPLIGALFYWLMPAHPFLVPNFVLGFLAVLFFFFVAAQLVTRAEALILLFALILKSKTMMFFTLIMPWNTIVNYAAVFAISHLLVGSYAGKRIAYLCIALVSIAAAARPQDTPLLGTFLLWALYVRFARNEFLKLAGVTCVLVTLAAILLAVLNLQAFGRVVPPYIDYANRVGMTLNSVGFRLYQLYVDGVLLHGNWLLSKPRSMLSELPLLLFALPGAWLLVNRFGSRAWPILGVTLATLIFNVSFNGSGSPPYFWSYHLYHYLWWTGVIGSLLGYFFLRELVLKHPVPTGARWAGLAGLAVLAFIGFGEKALSRKEGTPLAEMRLADGGSTLLLTSPGRGEKGLRVLFQDPLTLEFSEEAGRRAELRVGSDQWRYWKDYTVSQESRAINVHFSRQLPPAETPISITLPDLKASEPPFAQWIGIQFQPFAPLYLLSEKILGPLHALGRSPRLARPYRNGDTLRFGTAHGNVEYLAGGWSEPQEDLVWSVKKKAWLALGADARKPVGAGCAVELELSTLGPNTVRLEINGTPTGKLQSVNGERQWVRFTPCPQLDGADRLVLALEVDHLGSPRAKGAGGPKTAGLALHQLRVVDAGAR